MHMLAVVPTEAAAEGERVRTICARMKREGVCSDDSTEPRPAGFPGGVQRGPQRCAPLRRMLLEPSSRLAIAESQPALAIAHIGPNQRMSSALWRRERTLSLFDLKPIPRLIPGQFWR